VVLTALNVKITGCDAVWIGTDLSEEPAASILYLKGGGRRFFQSSVTFQTTWRNITVAVLLNVI
jgi:hypothetical protein